VKTFIEYKKSCHPIVGLEYHPYQIGMARKKLLNKKAVCKKANGQGRDLSNRQIATYFFI